MNGGNQTEEELYAEEKFYADGGEVCACCGCLNCTYEVDDSNIRREKHEKNKK